MDSLVEIATDLCANLATTERYDRLVRAVHHVFPCDACALLRLDDQGNLIPVATAGLVPEVTGSTFVPAEHPRLDALLRATGPVRFEDSDLPDPFDGLLAAEPDALAHVHACMGAPLVVTDEVVGLLTLDALDSRAFDAIPDDAVATFAALAAAAMRTAALVDTLENNARQQGMIAQQLVRDAYQSRGEMVGHSQAAHQLKDEIRRVAKTDLCVLIEGETGTGKELVAQGIHTASTRADRPLIRVNCAALPESIADSELFGHRRGSFTGAIGDRAGRFEVADGGTVFLDEIGELPMSIQAKLLRVVQSGEVQRVGSDQVTTVDVRIIAATNRDLEEEVAQGRFRADLFHRLREYPIEVPPLRTREGDIPLLAGWFIDRARLRLGVRNRIRLTDEARDALEDYGWPGNVRELKHVVTRAVLRASENADDGRILIGRAMLGLNRRPETPRWDVTVPFEGGYRDRMDAFAKQLVKRELEESNGNWATAARALQIDRGNLHRLARRLGIKKH